MEVTPEEWRRLERERVYHAIRAQPAGSISITGNAFLEGFRWRSGSAESIAQVSATRLLTSRLLFASLISFKNERRTAQTEANASAISCCSGSACQRFGAET